MKYNNIVILTGAGVSAESGLATFRASDGLWENHAIEDVATPEGYEANPDLVYQFYNERLAQLNDHQIHANDAHHALARLARDFDGQLLLVTQNIDDLHEQSGQPVVVHMHGELRQGRCPASEQLYPMAQPFGHQTCQCCQPSRQLRPHVVWFGEMPLQMDEIYQALAGCDLFVAIGTSGQVYPAAGFVEVARQAGADTLLLNLDADKAHDPFDEVRLGKATDLVPRWVEEILAIN